MSLEDSIMQTPEGIWVAREDTHISRWVEEHKQLDCDAGTLAIQCQYIKPGNTVVDVGACIGDTTICYARATAGSQWARVIAFEPNPIAFECLKRNMAGFKHVQCINAGLSDQAGEMEMDAAPNIGASYLRPGSGIKIIALDSLALPFLNFLKIDVEGLEVQALRGATHTIRRCRPVMWIEVNEGALVRSGTTPQELKEIILSLGYAIKDWKTGPQFDICCLPL